ncbi:MAG TPA: HesA/MoeB/ThiF family protein, partial [Candidatus Binataceae bacterium]|nr:HesA/MoeB/ThiF family protein [Candidatus Binataceae bacterium]
ILIVGIGGLGVPAALALARAQSVGRIGLIDPDPVELTNLHRQVIYTASDFGRPKVEAAASHLRGIDRELDLETFPLALEVDNAGAIIDRFDFVIDGTDNPATKFLINDVALATDTPFAYGGVLGMSGQAMTVIPHRTACLRCLFEDVPGATDVASCREAGILGPIAGAIGYLQAREALSIVEHRTAALAGRILTYDAIAAPRVRFTQISPRKGCICGAYERNIAQDEQCKDDRAHARH